MAKLDYSRESHTQKLKNNASSSLDHRTWLIGKYRGKKISSLPDSYLNWVFENFESGNFHRNLAAREILKRRSSK